MRARILNSKFLILNSLLVASMTTAACRAGSPAEAAAGLQTLTLTPVAGAEITAIAIAFTATRSSSNGNRALDGVGRFIRREFIDRKSLAHSNRRGPCPRVHRLGVRVEHVQPADSGVVAGSALVVQSAVYDLHDGAGAPRPERGVRRTVG